ncbi:MAG TPA: hypothetical protein VHG28_14340 [Longimicrobiaceae bacterium]|nr:hypothetical protein [Longimicrobiaceae bacterium]
MHIPRRVLAGTVALALCACSGGGGDGGTGPNPPPGGNPPNNPPPGTPVASAAVAAGANSDDFTPQTVDLRVGGTVTWTFGARAHEVVFQAVNGAPANIPSTTNAQVPRTFSTVGTFPYACGLHQGMTGTIRVQS